jgi:transposase-like protein
MAPKPANRKPPVRPQKRPTNNIVKAKRPTNGNGKYNAEEYPGLAYRICAEFGADNVKLAKALGVHDSTVKKWKRDYPEFKEQVLKGKDEFDSREVESSLLKRALGYKYDEVRKEEITLVMGRGKGKIELPAIKTTTTTKQVAPDVVAQIFYLKNRQPERWKDMRQEITKGTMEHKHKHEVPVIDTSDLGRAAEVFGILRAAGGIPAELSDSPSTKTH